MFKPFTLTAALAVLAGTAPPAHAQVQESPWGAEAAYTFDLLANTRGGLETGSRYLDKLDLIATFDGEKIGRNLSAQVYVMRTNDEEFSSELVGDAQVVSNIDAGEAFRLYEAWISTSLAGGLLTPKFGLIDLNTQFDVQSVGATFLNSSHGIGADFSQAGENGPSIFPETSLGLTLELAPAEDWSFRAGMFDGVPGDPKRPEGTGVVLDDEDGLLLVAEGERRRGRFRTLLGAWTFTGDFDSIQDVDPDGNPRRLTGNRGVYGSTEVRLFSEPAGGEDEGARGWVRVGWADADVNSVETYLGGGVVYTGLLPGRPQDQAGLAFAHARFGEPARLAAGSLEGAETAIEATYQLALNDHVMLQPDLQYVINPGGDPSLENALVAGLRVQLSWAR